MCGWFILVEMIEITVRQHIFSLTVGKHQNKPEDWYGSDAHLESRNRKIGIGLTIRQVRDVLVSVEETDLDKPFAILGHNEGYDFIQYAGPSEDELRIGTPSFNDVLIPVGRPVLVLQDHDIT